MHFQRQVQHGVGLESHPRCRQEMLMDNGITRRGIRDEDHRLGEQHKKSCFKWKFVI